MPGAGGVFRKRDSKGPWPVGRRRLVARPHAWGPGGFYPHHFTARDGRGRVRRGGHGGAGAHGSRPGPADRGRSGFPAGGGGGAAGNRGRVLGAWLPCGGGSGRRVAPGSRGGGRGFHQPGGLRGHRRDLRGGRTSRGGRHHGAFQDANSRPGPGRQVRTGVFRAEHERGHKRAFVRAARPGKKARSRL
ncbi:transcriptional accessory protein [hydrocarbon metagenome]|uniref:Transcriptional accessory protein n=1 Tax=hydrocarbon metagenome TaxID=938273 RepID=A0A0W8GA26_9ZZZZ